MPKFLSTRLAKSWAFSGLVLAVLLPNLSVGAFWFKEICYLMPWFFLI